jgi:hypothetical protein
MHRSTYSKKTDLEPDSIHGHHLMSDHYPAPRSRSPRSPNFTWGAILLLVALYFIVRPMLVEPAAGPLPSPAPSPEVVAESGEAQLGQLTDLGNGVQRSTAGLLYTPGSQEGHRLKHVMRHDDDQPSRPGLHGVFDGDADNLLAVIDEAYLLVKQNSPQVQSRREGIRIVHEVDLRRRIGFVGGQQGRRQGNPPATRVRLVLEEDRVITAFPF